MRQHPSVVVTIVTLLAGVAAARAEDATVALRQATEQGVGSQVGQVDHGHHRHGKAGSRICCGVVE